MANVGRNEGELESQALTRREQRRMQLLPEQPRWPPAGTRVEAIRGIACFVFWPN